MTDSAGGDDEDVGYCRPPTRCRWKVGQSGNPKGRPPKKHIKSMLEHLDPTSAMVVAHDAKQLVRRTHDGEETITRREAAFEKLFKNGLEGDTRALLAYLDISKSAQKAAAELEMNGRLAAIQHVERYLPEFLEAERRGKQVPNVLPDPRDIVFSSDGSFDVVGPVNLHDKIAVDEILAERDRIVQDFSSLEEKLNLPEEGWPVVVESFQKKIKALNDALPPRLRSQATAALQFGRNVPQIPR